MWLLFCCILCCLLFPLLFALLFAFFYFCSVIPSVLWYCWLGLLTCKTVSQITYRPTVLVETLNPAHSLTYSPFSQCSGRLVTETDRRTDGIGPEIVGRQKFTAVNASSLHTGQSVIHRVPKKTCDYIFYNIFNNNCPITIIFGTVSSKSMCHRKMVSFSTSPI